MSTLEQSLSSFEESIGRLGFGAVSPVPRNESDSPPSVTVASFSALVVVVDPVSTGACLAHQLASDGYPLVCVWSDMCPDTVKAHTKAGTEVEYVAKLQYCPKDGGKATLAALQQLGQIRDVLVGCETGVLCADVLAAALGVRGNGSELSTVRRNKWHQIEAVRAAGLDAPLQRLARSKEDVEEFLSSAALPAPFGAVVKPVDGAGSDGVFICSSADAVREAFRKLEGTHNVLGLRNNEVLLQEYLRGDEYVIDTVSRDGQHKCVALWKYDKRAANGAPVVYFGMRLLGVEAQPELEGMIAYVEGVLNAIGIRNGAMHTEVKLEARGPVLIEVNARLHGGEGIWLPISNACLGYTQVSAYRDAFFDQRAFDALPAAPERMAAQGAWVTVRANQGGRVTRLDQTRIDRIRALPSFLDDYFTPALRVGGFVAMTVDACTVHGCFNLVHADAEQLSADYATAQAIISAGIIEVE